MRLELPEEHELIRSVGAGPAAAELQTPIIQGLFDRDCLRDLIAAAQTGHLTLSSPVDGARLTTDAALCLNNDTMAYKFIDTRNGVVFYAIVALWRIALHGLYFPQSGLLVCRSPRTHKELGDFLGGTAETVMLRHVIAHAAAIEEYLQAPSRRVSLLYIQEHLGHHLYNELGGLDSVVREIPRERMPEILLINAPKSEMYGRIDRIFPELEGKVDRTPRDPAGLARHAYETRRCLVRPTDDYVSRDLANRIIRLAERDPALDTDRGVYDALVERGFTVVMLGLRVENRTLVDQTGFFIEAIDTMAEKLGRLAVVIDGHDTNATEEGVRAFRSHGEAIASRSVAEVENEILDQIRRHYHGRQDLAIISTVGATMSATLFWCVRSAFFICPWGAGLAKYRWVCNRPGLVVAGDRFLRHGDFLVTHLYDSREFMERPTRVVFFSADDVEDDPDAPMLIGLADAFRVNYRVRPGAVRRRVLELLASLQNSDFGG